VTAALDALGRDGLRAWHGLPAGAPPAALAPALELETDVLGMANLGRRKALFRGGALRSGDVPVRVWVTPDEAAVLALEFESPPFAPSGAQWRAALGEPGQRLDSYRGTVPQPAAEWVWPDRGAAAWVNPETDAVWRALLFAPVDPDGYEEQFRQHLRAARRPARRF
jgi:hypothetical protein